MRAVNAIVCRREQASGHGALPEHVEIVAGDDSGGDHQRGRAGKPDGDQAFGDERLQGLGLIAIVAVIGVAAVTLDFALGGAEQLNEKFRMCDAAHGVEQHGIEDSEKRGVRADSEAEQ